MRLLISNDDGVHAPGIKALVKGLSNQFDVTVVAPDRDRSGASNSLSLNNPIRVQRIEDKVYSIEGTPTDCVHLALTGLLDERPDMVISGINAGANLGDDILYSGTVAAATEGSNLGIPSIAFSLVGDDRNHYDTAVKVAKDMILKSAANPLPPSVVLNVNIPDIPYDALKGDIITRLGKRHHAEKGIKMTDPRGHTIYWIGLPGPEQDAGEGTDFHAINAHKVSVTPIKIDLTHYDALSDLPKWLEKSSERV